MRLPRSRLQAARGPSSALVAAIAMLSVLVLPDRALASDEVALREEALSFVHDRVELEGTVLIPHVPGEKPGLVLVHGAGPGRRETLRLEAEEFARRGIVVFFYDKRTEGYSQFERSYRLLADDALAAVRALASHPAVHRSAVGLWGVSEGAWVAPIAASSPDGGEEVAFVVLVAGTGVSPASQHSWFLEGQLRDRGVGGSMIDAVAYRGLRLVISMGLFGEPFHDPVPTLEAVSQPVLALWGENDTVQPPAESHAIFDEALGGERESSLVVFPGAGHSLRIGGQESARLVDGYPDLVAGWVTDVSTGEAAQVSGGPAPTQDHFTRHFSPLSWWESVWVVLGVQLSLLVGAVAGLVRFRHLDDPVSRRWHRLLATAGLVALLGHFTYINLVLIAEAELIGPVIGNQALIWIALRMAVVVALIAALVLTLTRLSRGGTRSALPAVSGVFALWASYWGLIPGWTPGG